MSYQNKRWIWLEPSRLHLIARVCQGAEPDWNHEEPGKTFADTMQDDISSVAFWYQEGEALPFPPLPDKDYLEII